MANLNLMKVIIAGRLTRDPELKTTPAGKSVCEIAVAVNRKVPKDAERMTDFFECVAFGGTAEFIARFFHKGESILIDGHGQIDKWQSKDGQPRQAFKVIVDEAVFVDGKNEKPESVEAPQFEDITNEEALPF